MTKTEIEACIDKTVRSTEQLMVLLDIPNEGTEDTHTNEGQNCEKSLTSKVKRLLFCRMDNELTWSV